jgi:hypothetical protein
VFLLDSRVTRSEVEKRFQDLDDPIHTLVIDTFAWKRYDLLDPIDSKTRLPALHTVRIR